ncbi:DUF3817 domain-containing protein [Massilia sp. KIM]|uniref:DUF3817 domain-containing protein n=1 Tax=Massilia sp. KIM TaxID=1955422 RepID=UPI00098FDF61|nr:DUF3817 domain-containing protein [Massilia sp. KIM]
MNTETPRPFHAVPSRRLFRRAALLEGSTLLLLVLVAVPAKHLLGEPGLVRALGPLHGLAFLFYLWALMGVSADASWPRGRTALLVLAACLPFGSFIALRRMREDQP